MAKHPVICAWISFVFLSWGVAVPGLWAAEKPADDLQPLKPISRALFADKHPFWMQGDGLTQVFSADGKTLFIGTDRGWSLWDLANLKPYQPRPIQLGGFRFHNATVALSDDGKTAALAERGGGPPPDTPICFFDTVTGKPIHRIKNSRHINEIALSPDGRFLAVSMFPQMELWDASNGEEVRGFAIAANSLYRLLTFSPDGKMLAAIAFSNRYPPPPDPSTMIQIWETASGKERLRIRLVEPPVREENRMYYYAQAIGGLAFSVDNRFLAASRHDSAVHLWNLHSGKEMVPLSGVESSAGPLLFSPDGKELHVLDFKGNLLTWKWADIRQLQSARLPSLSESAFAELWTELAQTDAFRVYRAERHLLADPKRTLALLGEHLKPVPPGDTARLRQLVADLDNANPAVRRKAMMELRTKHGEAAVGALVQNANPRQNNFGMTFEQKLRDLYNTPERTRDIKAVRILEEIGTPQAQQILDKLSKGAAGVPLTVEAKSALDRLAATKKSPRVPTSEELWTDLASEDAARAYRAMCRLSNTPAQAVALLQKELKPTPVVEDKEIARLLSNLEADDFKVREQATESLEKLGEQVVPVLKKALAAKPALEARKRMEQLLEHLTTQTSAVVLRSLRALEVLEHLGTAEAKHVLLALAGGAPPALLTREAKASLQRLSRR